MKIVNLTLKNERFLKFLNRKPITENRKPKKLIAKRLSLSGVLNITLNTKSKD